MVQKPHGYVPQKDEIIKLIRSSKSPAEAREDLMDREWPAKDVKSLIKLIDDSNSFKPTNDFNNYFRYLSYLWTPESSIVIFYQNRAFRRRKLITLI